MSVGTKREISDFLCTILSISSGILLLRGSLDLSATEARETVGWAVALPLFRGRSVQGIYLYNIGSGDCKLDTARSLSSSE